MKEPREALRHGDRTEKTTEIDGKVARLAAVTRDLVKRGVKASDRVRTAVGGGGRPDLAEAGGTDPAKIDEALAAAREYFRGALAD